MHTPTLSHIFRFLILISAGLVPVLASAQTPADETEPIDMQLNQPFESKNIGQLNFPFRWNVEEKDQTITAVQPDTKAPATISVHLVDTTGFDAKLTNTLQDNIIQSIAQALGATVKPSHSNYWPCKKNAKTCNGAYTLATASFSGTEKGHEHSCSIAVYTITDSKQSLVFSLCAPESRTFDPKPEDVLKNLFKSIK